MIAALTNHLWQSTLFVLAAAIVAAALRQNGAHVRHRIWVVASLKFLVPFSLLISLGASLPAFTTTTAASTAVPDVPALSIAVGQIAQPFTDDVNNTSAPEAPRATTNWTAILFGAWACGFIVVALMRLRDWQRVRAAVRASTRIDLTAPVPVCSSPGLLEPGVVGLFRPVLLLPAGIEGHLTPPQLEAVLAHELCHVQRRDNLTSAIHMAVEAAFWFHPLVWWIGARLIDERERACDEYVLRVCGEPQVYAESILNVCKRYVESPLACVSGVGGSDLRKRVAAILVNRVGLQLSVARKVTLVSAAALAIVLPLVAGMLIAPLGAQSSAGSKAPVPKWDVVSVKPCAPDEPPSTGRSAGAGASPGYLSLSCLTLRQFVSRAYLYNYQDHLRNRKWEEQFVEGFSPFIRGGPSWVSSEKFTIEAKAEGVTDQYTLTGPMMRALLEDRFQVKTHRATEERSMYALTVAKGGFKFKPLAPGDCYEDAQQQSQPGTQKEHCGYFSGDGWGTSQAQGVTFGEAGREGQRFIDELWRLMFQPIIDRTGLNGRYSFPLNFTPDENTPGVRGRCGGNADCIARLSASGTSDAHPTNFKSSDTIFKAVERLGLKLEKVKAPAEYLVIDSAERPRPNDALPLAEPPARAAGPGVPMTPQEKFDVASIKPNSTTSGQMGLNAEPGGRLVGTNVTLQQLVVAAYNLQDFQLVGAPDWLTKDHFDLEAKAPAGGPSNLFEPAKDGSPTRGELLLRTLLADRFKLRVHSETRDMPLYELAFVQNDRTPGPGLKASSRRCSDPDVDAPAPARPSDAPPCGMTAMPGTILSGGVTMSDFASWLSRIAGRYVVDRTGSTERFEFALKWTPDRVPPGLSKKAGSTHWAAIDDDGPPLPTALKEQLGLKLESKTGPVNVLVIDGVAHLIPN